MWNWRDVLKIVTILPLAFVIGCDHFSSRVVAEVNGEKITMSDLEKAMQVKIASQEVQGVISPRELRRLKEEVLSEAINGMIIEQRARQLSVNVDREEINANLAELKASYEGSVKAGVLGGIKIDDEQWKRHFQRRRLYEKVIEKDVYAKIAVGEEEARNFYNSHPDLYRHETSIRLAQIVTDDEKKAERILARIKNGEDFAELAKRESISPEGANGGDLGFISRGAMPPIVDKIGFSLPVGKVSDVVQSAYGYHLLKVLERSEQKGSGFEQVKARVMEDLKQRKGEEAFHSWMVGLRKEAKIKINGAVVADFMSLESSEQDAAAEEK